MKKLGAGPVLIAALAGLLFGFDTAVISGVTQAIKTVFSLQDAGLGFAVSSALWGTLIGALLMGRLGDAIGGRDALKITAAMYLVSSFGCAVSHDFVQFCISRFILGVAIGGSSVLAPVYIAEIATAKERGFLVGLFQFNIVFGILVAYLSNFVVARVVEGEMAWRWKLAVPIAPALIFLVLLFAIPQSARWLASKGRLEEARDSLRRLGTGDSHASFLTSDVNTDAQRLSWARHKKPITLVVLLALFNQLTGINAILYFLNDIFAAAGFGRLASETQSVAIGFTNLLATVIGMFLIDRVGRRTLLVMGALGMAAALSCTVVIMATDRYQGLLLPCLIAFIFAFALSQGAVIWVYMSEIFPTPVRASGQSIGAATHWAANAVIATVFPVVASHTKAMPFAVFAACTLIQAIVVHFYFPETKGIALEDMTKTMKPSSAT
jgi:sugar porter (SP) family MFS transporter